MNFSDRILKSEEIALYRLRDLYRQYGYTRYKVSKFEEYDLYARNKNFLISENILTFTDTNGKLMALKPDITLSIVKNVGKDNGALNKLCYNETVYRTAAGSDGFREIMQTGLECIGNLDLFAVAEVLMLARKSLSLIGEKSLLDLSHMGLITGLLENAGIDPHNFGEVLDWIKAKNTGAIRAYCEKNAVVPEVVASLCQVTQLYEPLETALEQIKPLVSGEKMQAAYEELCGIAKLMRAYGCLDGVYLDFSIVNDMNYYNGIMFRGFVNGIPDGVLSGGRYDSLLERMGKHTGAIGFAVYLDLLDRLNRDIDRYDADVLLTYDSDFDAEALILEASKLRDGGKSVLIQRAGQSAGRCREQLHFAKGNVERVEKR